MSIIDSLSSSPLAPTSSAPMAQEATRRNDEMGKEEFLLLLVTQLKHQDPMSPMDGQQFAAQLAQFSSVEQLIGMNQAMSGQAEMQGLLAQNVNSGVAAGLIGKHVEAMGNQVGLQAGSDAPVSFALDGAAATVKIEIRDEAGNLVRTIEQQNLDRGEHRFDWDGKNNGGGRLPDGLYSYEVTALDGKGEPVAAQPLMKGRVDRVSFGQDGIQVWVNNVAVPMGSIRSVEEG